MLDRIIGVLKLDANTYEEIEADPSATSQAAIVVAVVAVIGGLIGGGISAALGGNFLGSFLQQLITAFIGWFVWAAVTYFVGTSLFGGQSTIGQMLRVLGFAQAPGILAIIPICGSFVGWIWSIATGFVAVRQGLDLDNGKALATIVIGWVAVFVVSLVVGLVLGALGLAGSAGMEALQGFTG